MRLYFLLHTICTVCSPETPENHYTTMPAEKENEIKQNNISKNEYIPTVKGWTCVVLRPSQNKCVKQHRFQSDFEQEPTFWNFEIASCGNAMFARGLKWLSKTCDWLMLEACRRCCSPRKVPFPFWFTTQWTSFLWIKSSNAQKSFSTRSHCFCCHIKSQFAKNKSVTQTRSVDLCFAQTEEKPLPIVRGNFAQTHLSQTQRNTRLWASLFQFSIKVPKFGFLCRNQLNFCGSTGTGSRSCTRQS